ncbi:MAG: hypothetical protein HZC28_09155 [Spirochaetes bacterium]|nr:hypothetical protein [Spirochaetota bacterium]
MADTLGVFIVNGAGDSSLSRLSRGKTPMLTYGGRYRIVDFAVNSAVIAGAKNIAVIDGDNNNPLGMYIAAGWKSRAVRYMNAGEHVYGALMDAYRAAPTDYVLILPSDTPVFLDYAEIMAVKNDRSVMLVGSGKDEYALFMHQRLFNDGIRKVSRQEQTPGNVLLSGITHFEREFGKMTRCDVKKSFAACFATPFEYYRASLKRIPYFQNIYSYTSQQMATVIIGEQQTVIERGADVSQSILADGVRIEGDVRGSLIGTNVVIHKHARVINSIILPGNVIAKGAVVTNTIIGENDMKALKTEAVIGEHAHIGGEVKGEAGVDDVTAVLSGVVVPRHARIPKGIILEGVGQKSMKKREME